MYVSPSQYAIKGLVFIVINGVPFRMLFHSLTLKSIHSLNKIHALGRLLELISHLSISFIAHIAKHSSDGRFLKGGSLLAN